MAAKYGHQTLTLILFRSDTKYGNKNISISINFGGGILLYIVHNQKVDIFEITDKMAALNLNLIYLWLLLSVSTCKFSIHSYGVSDVEVNYVEINNNYYLFLKRLPKI